MNEVISLTILLGIAMLIGFVTVRLFYGIFSSYLNSIKLNSANGMVDIWDIAHLEGDKKEEPSCEETRNGDNS